MPAAPARFPALVQLRHHVKGNHGITVRYCPVKTPFWMMRQQLQDRWNPAVERVRYEYSKMPEDELNWRVIANTAVKELPKAVLRERVRRRITAALAEAMRRRGFKQNGKRIDPSKDETPVPAIKGTLELYIHQGRFLHEDFETLVGQAERVLDTISEPKNQRVQFDRQLLDHGKDGGADSVFSGLNLNRN